MGAWGAGPFENDVAADVLDEVGELPGRRRGRYVDTLLSEVLAGDDPLDADVATAGIAAVALVVASGVPDVDLLAADELDGAVVPVGPGRWKLAARVVRTLQERPGELGDLWEEAGGAAELAAVLQQLAGALASPAPKTTPAERIRRVLRRPARHGECEAPSQSRHPEVLYAVAGPDSHVFALGALSSGGGWWVYTLTALAPGNLPAVGEITLDDAVWQMSREGRFATDDLALYDGTMASAEAALLRAPEVPEDLAEWLAETVELAEVMEERIVPWV